MGRWDKSGAVLNGCGEKVPPYELFQHRVSRLLKKAGGGISAEFSADEEKGKYFARCSDGTTIIGRPSSLKVTVLFGSGHQAMAVI